MKRAILFFAFFTFFLVSSGNAVADIITHSVSGYLRQYIPEGQETPIDLYDPFTPPEVIHLFDVTFDTSGTSFDSITPDGTESTITLDDVREYNPDAVFLSNAEFTFTSEFLAVFPLLGISAPSEATNVGSYVMGHHDEEYSEDPVSYYYVSGFNLDGIMFYSPSIFHMNGYEFPISGSGTVLKGTEIEGGQFEVESIATYQGVEYQVVTQTQVPEPATLLLLGSGLAGLAGLRRRVRK